MPDRVPLAVKKHSGWQIPHLRSLFQNHFVVYDLLDYQKISSDTLVLIRNDEVDDPLIQQLASQGHKIVVDNNWDGHENVLCAKFPIFELKIDCFFWIHEYGWHRYHELDQIIINPTYQHIALMPTRHERMHKTQAIHKFHDLLDQMIWSSSNRALPDDHPQRSDRFFNRSWYDHTAMSVVLETAVETLNSFPLLSEKTFKPIIFGHPFLILGCMGSLEWLHNRGFVSFDNIFDESYDNLSFWPDRLDSIVQNVFTVKNRPWDDETQRRIQHNKMVFFDHARVENMVKEHFADPLRELYETI